MCKFEGPDMRILLITFFLTFWITVDAQDSLVVRFQPNVLETPGVKFPEPPDFFPDSLSALNYISDIQIELIRSGYLASSVDAVGRVGDTLWVSLTLGRPYKWANLRKGNLDTRILSQAGFRNRYFDNEPLSVEQLGRLFDRIIGQYENNGYPFASVELDSVGMEEEYISATLMIDKGPLITIDTLVVIGDANISTTFLANYLDIHPGDLYEEEAVREMASRIRTLPYLRMTQNPEVQFIREQARVVLYLEGNRASRFDFLIGILPNNAQRGGKLLINGEATINLVNAFGTGKTLLAEWGNLQPRSPQLNARFIYPYLLNTPLGFDGKFHLFKRDTLFVDIEGEVGLQYLFGGQNYVKLFSSLRSTNLISVDTQRIKNTKQLPDQLDARYRLFGLEYYTANVDNIYTPRRGWQATFNVATGSKSIRPNNTIVNIEADNFDYTTLYDTVAANSLAIRAMVDVAKYWPLSRFFVLKTSVHVGYLYGEDLILNELYRIGGMKLLRGFDEESVLASWYNIGTAELRFLIGQNSYFSAFVDGGYVEREQRSLGLETNWPFGTGVGLTFETGAGIFALNYAIGRLNADNPFQLRNAKIHFGYLSYF